MSQNVRVCERVDPPLRSADNPNPLETKVCAEYQHVSVRMVDRAHLTLVRDTHEAQPGYVPIGLRNPWV